MVLLTACFALATVGAGTISLDYPLFESAKGSRSSPPKPKK
jgi:hypothetical protein